MKVVLLESELSNEVSDVEVKSLKDDDFDDDGGDDVCDNGLVEAKVPNLFDKDLVGRTKAWTL